MKTLKCFDVFHVLPNIMTSSERSPKSRETHLRTLDDFPWLVKPSRALNDRPDLMKSNHAHHTHPCFANIITNDLACVLVHKKMKI